MAFAHSGKRKYAVSQQDDASASYHDLDQLFLSPTKRARRDDSDSLSDYAASPLPSLAEATTITLADTSTLISETSGSGSRTKPRSKRFKCTYPECDKIFDRPIRLQVHYNTHTGQRPYVCPHDGCDKKFYKSSHLKAHIQEKHIEQRDFVCTFSVHSAEASGKVQCGRAFPTSTKLKRHVAQHEGKEETTCSWDGCGKVFRKQDTLQRHIKKEHLNELPYLCTQDTADGGACGKAFSTPGLLKSHIAHQHSSVRYWCELCNDNDALPPGKGVLGNDLDGAFLPTANDLREGVGSELFDALSLEDCSSNAEKAGKVAFATFAELQLHNREVHPPTCFECGKQCRSNKDLKAHLDIYHSGPGCGPEGSPKDFLCPIEGCRRASPGNGFTRKGNMDVHVRSVHAREKSFICGEHDLAGNEKVIGWNGIGCQLALSTKQGLIAHIRTQHLGLEAGMGVRNGLCKSFASKKGRPKKDVATAEDSLFTGPAGVATPAPGPMLAMLTGAGYEDHRPVPCLLSSSSGCQMRFARERDLAVHLELTHGWQVDDIQEALASGIASLAWHGEVGAPFSRSDQTTTAERGLAGCLEATNSTDTLDPQLHQGME